MHAQLSRKATGLSSSLFLHPLPFVVFVRTQKLTRLNRCTDSCQFLLVALAISAFFIRIRSYIIFTVLCGNYTFHFLQLPVSTPVEVFSLSESTVPQSSYMGLDARKPDFIAWLKSIKHIFINVSYHIQVVSLNSDGSVLKQSHQS